MLLQHINQRLEGLRAVGASLAHVILTLAARLIQLVAKIYHAGYATPPRLGAKLNPPRRPLQHPRCAAPGRAAQPAAPSPASPRPAPTPLCAPPPARRRGAATALPGWPPSRPLDPLPPPAEPRTRVRAQPRPPPAPGWVFRFPPLPPRRVFRSVRSRSAPPIHPRSYPLRLHPLAASPSTHFLRRGVSNLQRHPESHPRGAHGQRVLRCDQQIFLADVRVLRQLLGQADARGPQHAGQQLTNYHVTGHCRAPGAEVPGPPPSGAPPAGPPAPRAAGSA